MSDKLVKHDPKALKKRDYLISAVAGLGVWAFVPWIGGPATGLATAAVILGRQWLKRKTS